MQEGDPKPKAYAQGSTSTTTTDGAGAGVGLYAIILIGGVLAFGAYKYLRLAHDWSGSCTHFSTTWRVLNDLYTGGTLATD